MDEAFAQELEAVDWFAACGQPLAVSLPFPLAPVGGWAEAIERCSDQSWGGRHLGGPQPADGVPSHPPPRRLPGTGTPSTVAAKERVVTPLMDRVWRPFAERHGFGKVLVDCVSWDVLAAIMEHEYRDCPGRPEWFLQLLRVYRAGHFPCGWAGEWPAGQLLVW